MKTRVMMATLKRHPPSHQRHQSPSRARIPQVPSTDLKRPTDAQRQRRHEAQAGRGGGRGRHLSSDPSVQALHHTPETWVAVRLQHWMGGSHRVGPTLPLSKVPPGPGRDSQPTRCCWREGSLATPRFRGAS